MNIKINKNLTFKNNQQPLIVAEISGNHKGKKSLFLRHIVQAAKNGADLIKIQTYEPQDITFKSKHKKFLIKKGIWKGKNIWQLYQKAYTPFSWHKDAFKLSKKLGVTLFSSPFSIRAVDLLEKYNVKLYKVASFEITDLNLINYIAKTKKPIILSTGMATLKEINTAIKVIEKYHKKIIILYCVSGYPTLEEETNMITLKKFKKIFKNYLVGISDHTNDIFSSLTATALGAVMIEKHFIISKKSITTDSKFSIDIKNLRRLKDYSLKIYKSLGKQFIGPKKNELNSLKLRRSIYANRDIKKGERFNKKNLICLRPKIGIGSENYFKILGKKSSRFFKKNSPIYL